MGELVPMQQKPLHPALARIAQVEERLSGVVDKLVEQGEGDLPSRDRSRIVLTTLQYLNYVRQLAKFEAGAGEDLNENDLVAMPQADLEKIMKFCVRQLGPERVKELSR